MNIIEKIFKQKKTVPSKYKWKRTKYSHLPKWVKDQNVQIGESRRFSGNTYQYEIRTQDKGIQGSTYLAYYRRLKM